MKIRDILLDIVCTEFPIMAGALLSKVLTYAELNPNKTQSDLVIFPVVKAEIDALCEEGLLCMTEVNMSKKYHRNMQ